MGRMHAPGKGLSQSALPYRRSVPTWLKLTSDDVKEQIYKLAKKGLTPSQIGVILRDSHGVAQVRFVTGNKILRILKSKGLAPDLPEDLYHLIKKAVAVRKHLERNRKDTDSPPCTSLLVSLVTDTQSASSSAASCQDLPAPSPLGPGPQPPKLQSRLSALFGQTASAYCSGQVSSSWGPVVYQESSETQPPHSETSTLRNAC
uniref:Small ribosomal subunit protein uS15 n=1 Tax=Oryctolagus cuniculus TaxID=9986 RepID=A0A5F9CMH6_RABIT